MTDRLGLALDVGEGGPVTPLQPLLDERPEDDLTAHRKLEADRRFRRDDSSLDRFLTIAVAVVAVLVMAPGCVRGPAATTVAEDKTYTVVPA